MDRGTRKVVYSTKTDLDDYEVIEEVYTARPARVLYGGKYKTAQSGIPLDDNNLMLFEYNQRLVELIDQLKPKHILAIGGGAFTLPSHVTNKYPDMSIDVVEPDSRLEDIAKKYFRYNASGKIKIVNDSGLHYLKKNRKKYDLVIVDAYQDNQIPSEILTRKFAKLAAEAVNGRGLIAANVISDLSSTSPISQMSNYFSKYLKLDKIYPAGPDRIFYYPTNFILVLSNHPINFVLKFPALSSTNIKR